MERRLEAALADYATVESVQALDERMGRMGERLGRMEEKQSGDMQSVHSRLEDLERWMQGGAGGGGSGGGVTDDKVNQRLSDLEEETAAGLELDAGIMQQVGYSSNAQGGHQLHRTVSDANTNW